MILSNHDRYLKNGLYDRAEKTADVSPLSVWQPTEKLNFKIRSAFPRGYLRQIQRESVDVVIRKETVVV